MPIREFNLQNKNEKLAEYLKNPGDFVLFKLVDEDKKDDIHLAYVGKRVPESSSLKTTKQSCIVERKIKYRDYTDRFKENYDELHEFIHERLVTFIGFDFDDTLTYHHTETKADMLKKHKINKANNRLFPQTTDAVIKKLLSIPHIKFFIATFNTSKLVNEHLNEWGLKGLDIFALGDSKSTTAFPDKSLCFQNAFQTYIAPVTEYLDFKILTNSNIGLIDSHLVDDDPKNNLEEFGINFIHARDKEKPVHLHELNTIFALQINIDELCKNETKPQEKTTFDRSNITGKSLSFTSDDEPPSPSKTYLKREKSLQDFSKDSEHEESTSKKLFTKPSHDTKSTVKTASEKQSSWMNTNSPSQKSSESTNCDDSDCDDSVSSDIPLKVTVTRNRLKVSQ